ncbi:MAG: SET domain-containing protein [Vampirovibrionales bacterium]
MAIATLTQPNYPSGYFPTSALSASSNPPVTHSSPQADQFVIRSPQGLVKKNSFLHPNLRLETAPNGNKRVVATGPIQQGDLVCIFVGDIITRDELLKLPITTQRQSLQLAENIYQVGSKDPNKAPDEAEFFNHSCNPNTVLTGNNVLVAKRTIAPGEELTYDYGTSDTQGNPDTNAWPCTCGSTPCRGTNSPEAYKTIIPQLAAQYGPQGAYNRVADYVAKKYQAEVTPNPFAVVNTGTTSPPLTNLYPTTVGYPVAQA